MPKQRRSRRTLTILVLLVLVSVTVITLDETGRFHGFTSGLRKAATDVFSPFRRGVDDVVNPIGRFFAGAFHYGALEQENAHLRTEISSLEHKKTETTFAARQLNALRQADELQTLPSVAGLRSVVAQKVSGPVSDFKDTITIGKGSSSGVSVGDPVLAPGAGGGMDGGLVGVVEAVGAGTATVELITTGAFAVGVVYGKDQDTTLSGQGARKPLIATIVPSQTAVTTKTLMETTNLSGAEYPPDIPVATVATVRSLPGASDKTVTATPVADLSDITYVAVVMWGTGR